MNNLKNTIDEINKKAHYKIVKAIWDEVKSINNTLDLAGSLTLDSERGMALRLAGVAVDRYMELVALCKETSEQPLREHLRDALGSVKWGKFELPANIMTAIEKARNEAANKDLLE